jgi:hypothetical protein
VRDTTPGDIRLARLAARGLPELDQFEFPEHRERAFRALAERYVNSRFMIAFGTAMAILPALAVQLLSDWLDQLLTRFLGWPQWTQFLAILLFVALPACVVPLVYLRSRVRRDVRELLILRDIPVCRGCGYSLRGQPPDSDRCPECGQAIRDDVRRIIAGPQRFDLTHPPPDAETESSQTNNPAESAR